MEGYCVTHVDVLEMLLLTGRSVRKDDARTEIVTFPAKLDKTDNYNIRNRPANSIAILNILQLEIYGAMF